ncbi:M67 family metallopeptidase [Magnetovibrio sp.]|uniref:M67 family metallopeptidase n=1 Tax=Magnetovibrio sp. TaxID=2024836 RepID=UPI002F95E452
MIHFSPSQLQEIRAHAERAYPFECCGLLVGTRGGGDSVTVTRVVSSDNVRIDADGSGGRDRFEIDPQVRFDVMHALRGTDEDIVGHYHSHPDHPAEPSVHDIAMAFEPDMVWLIVSVVQGQSRDARAWKLNRDSDAVNDVTLIVEQG